MNHKILNKNSQEEVKTVFTSVFTASEGDKEGRLIGNLASELCSRTDVVTYGDPSFYSKVGFQPLSENVIQAPLMLSMPEGWLGQSLTKEPIPTVNDRPRCVKEFNDPVYW